MQVSLQKASANVKVTSLKLDELISKKLYTRSIDPLASTQFTYSLLVPKLMNYNGWAVFVIVISYFCVNKLTKELDDSKAVFSKAWSTQKNIEMDDEKNNLSRKIGQVL